MPNWCSNSLKLVATTAESEKKLAEIVQELSRAKAAGEDAEFFKLIKPVPEALQITAGYLGAGTPEQTALLETEKRNLDTYGYKNWYDFCVAEWGTKWDSSTQDMDEPFNIDGNAVTIFFDTAWSPPMGIYHALEDMGFKLEATYVEQGVGFIGYYSDGVDKCDDMENFRLENEDDEEYFDVLMEKIDAYFSNAGFDHSPTNFGG
jgi:hypothetical protein